MSVSEVYEILSSLDTSKAMGLHGIGPNVLKHCASALCESLQHLFNGSLRQHNIPAERKIHNISPIHKSGDCLSVTNYRSISLTSSTSKVLERIFYNKCIDFLESIIFHLSISSFEKPLYLAIIIGVLQQHA